MNITVNVTPLKRRVYSFALRMEFDPKTHDSLPRVGLACYEEEERQTTRHKWRAVRRWGVMSGPEGCGYPQISKEILDKVLRHFRDQIQFDFKLGQAQGALMRRVERVRVLE